MDAQLTECPICMDIFKDPILLNNCGHSICRECAMALPRKRCPTCRKTFSMRKVKKNFALANIADYAREAEEEKRRRKVEQEAKEAAERKRKKEEEMKNEKARRVELEKQKEDEKRRKRKKERLPVGNGQKKKKKQRTPPSNDRHLLVVDMNAIDVPVVDLSAVSSQDDNVDDPVGVVDLSVADDGSIAASAGRKTTDIIEIDADEDDMPDLVGNTRSIPDADTSERWSPPAWFVSRHRHAKRICGGSKHCPVPKQSGNDAPKPVTKKCPTATCSFKIAVVPDVADSENEPLLFCRKFSCPECNVRSCLKCKIRWVSCERLRSCLVSPQQGRLIAFLSGALEAAAGI
eukprot:g1588.t1